MKNRRSLYSVITCTLLALIVAGVSLGETGVFQNIFTPSLVTPRVVPTTVTFVRRSDLERGMAAAVWAKDGYNQNNAAYQQALREIYPQTGATWISMQVSFSQDTDSSTAIYGGSPTLDSFTQGIHAARKAGYHIFFEPLLSVAAGTDHWCGLIAPQSIQQETLWFQSWFHALQPYIVVAQKVGVGQIAIGTELEWLQYHAPANLWNQLITQVHRIFTGKIIYDTNWDFKKVGLPFPSWFQNPYLSALGVSTYLPLTSTRSSIPASQATSIWNEKVGIPLKKLSLAIHKPIVLSEFGYRDTSDAGYNPYEYRSSLPQDLQEQSLLFNAAFANIMQDGFILGVFVWCWSNGNRFSLAGHPVLAVIHSWYRT